MGKVVYFDVWYFANSTKSCTFAARVPATPPYNAYYGGISFAQV